MSHFQVQRVLSNLREYSTDLQRYIHLMALQVRTVFSLCSQAEAMTMVRFQERNERLFYRVMIEHIEEILPIV